MFIILIIYVYHFNHFNKNYMRTYIYQIAVVHGMADPENIALGRPAQQKGSNRYPTSGAFRGVDGVFDGTIQWLFFILSRLLFCWTPVLQTVNLRSHDKAIVSVSTQKVNSLPGGQHTHTHTTHTYTHTGVISSRSVLVVSVIYFRISLDTPEYGWWI